MSHHGNSPAGKNHDWRQKMRAIVAADMLSHSERANLVLLKKLRKALPHAKLPDTLHVPPDRVSQWWPLTNRWAMAMDDMMRNLGMPPTNEMSDPEQCLKAIVERSVADERQAYEGEVAFRSRELAR